ncbi:MAG: hypothetical protein Q9208_003406 [Pyrenodesmia sp. 3 TL-2023]
MPLHLLGKKSWNVYNQDNIERVKRDEAAAAAREAAEEQRMQEVDAERRIQILRGIQPTAVAELPSAVDVGAERGEPSNRRERKRRRIAGEDDTDRDLRFAREDQEANNTPKADVQLTQKKTSDAPLMDRRGHIDLFPMEGSRHNAPKNAEVEAEKAKKKKEYEDQYTMRFSNAAGFKQAIGEKPWYQSMGTAQDDAVEVPSKDVWGNDDPRRKERERMRVATDDPMAAMQRGVTQLREVERERKQWREERDRETRSFADADRRSRRKTKRKREDDELEGFSLDAPAADDRRSSNQRQHRRRHRHRHKSASPEHSRGPSHRSRRRDREHDKSSKTL